MLYWKQFQREQQIKARANHSLALELGKEKTAYVSNEKADSPSGDGVSNRLSVPVKAGNRSSLTVHAKTPPAAISSP